MTEGPDATTLAWLQAVHGEVKHLKENHLAHVDADLRTIKDELKNVHYRVGEIERDVEVLVRFRDEIAALVRSYGRKVIVGFFTAFGAALGINSAGIL